MSDSVQAWPNINHGHRRRRPRLLVSPHSSHGGKQAQPACHSSRDLRLLAPATITTLLLLFDLVLHRHGCHAYLSTMHLGRTLKAFQAADADNALLYDPRNEAASKQLEDQQEELGHDETPAICSNSGVDDAHPSWTSTAVSAVGVGVAEAAAAAAPATADVYTAGLSNLEEEYESGIQDKAGLDESEELVRSDGGGSGSGGSGGAAAAAAAAGEAGVDVVRTDSDGRVVSAQFESGDGVGAEDRHVMLAGLSLAEMEAEDEGSPTRIALQQRELGESHSLDTVAAEAAERTVADLSTIPNPQSEADLLLAPEIEAPGTTGTPTSRDKEESEEEEEEDVETTAMRELLRLREEQDLRVQAAAEAALENLPDRQRAQFHELKAFAYSCSDDGEHGEGPQTGLSADEASTLDSVAICGDRNGVILAFLRHSKFNVKKAKESMRRCCKWRRETEADSMFARGASSAKVRKHRKHWPTGFHREDREGRPVFYDRVGQVDLATLCAEPDGLDMDDMVQIFCQNMEARRRFVLTRLSREAGCPVDQTTTVLDLSGMGMKHMSKDALTYTRRISDIFQDNYSGMTTSLLVVNTPWVFSTGWQMIQGFLSEDTAAKVKVLGKGEAGLEKLAEYIPTENIPDFLGGPSRTTMGPEDPLWAEVDRATLAWANGSDPFVDKRALRAVGARLRKERARRDAAAAAVATGEKAVSAAGQEDSMAPALGEGGLQDEGLSLPREGRDRPRRAAGRRAQGSIARDTAGAWEQKEYGKEKDTVGQDVEEDNGTKEGRQLKTAVTTGRRTRQRSGSVSSARTRVDGKNRQSQRHARHYKETATTSEQVGVSTVSSSSLQRRTKVVNSTSGREVTDLESSSRRARAKRRSARSRDESNGEEGRRAESVAKGEESGTMEWLVQRFVPAAKAVLLLVVASMLNVSKVVWNAILAFLLFLRDALFEEVEEEEDDE